MRPGTLLLAVLCLGGAEMPAAGQTLVEAAARAAKTRARLGPPDKVYTAADLPEAPRFRPPLAATEPGAETSATLESPAVAALRAALERERRLLEVLRRRLARRQAPPRPAADEETDAARDPPGGGIPLALAYGTPYVPYVGARGVRVGCYGTGRAGAGGGPAGHWRRRPPAGGRPGHWRMSGGHVARSRPGTRAPGLVAGTASTPPMAAPTSASMMPPRRVIRSGRW